jgi:hypothetical protein
MDFGGATMKGYDAISTSIASLIPIYIFIDDQPFDPYSVVYSIYGRCGQTIQNNQQASRFTTGEYYANFPWNSPTQLAILKSGQCKIVWEIIAAQFMTAVSTADEFTVYKQRSEACQASHMATGFNVNTQSGTGNFPDFGMQNACWQYAYSQFNLQWGITCSSTYTFTRQSGVCNYPFC